MNIEHKLQDTRCTIRNKGIKTLGLGLLILIFAFGRSVDEIINKIEANQAKIIDLEAEVEIETSIQGRTEPLIQTMKLWQAKDEKGNPMTRTEFEMPVMNRQGEMEKRRKGEKVIMVMTKDSALTKKGKTVSRLPMTAQANIEARFEGILRSARSIRILRQEGNVAVLELIPKETEGIKLFDKAEITVDTEKGVITNQKLFTPMGVIKTEMNYEKLEVGSEKLEVLKEMRTITQYGITTMRYKNIKINKGIDKKRFEL